jgi:hypothetical protein
LALRLGQPADQWAMMALLLHLDLAMAKHNVRARGRVARQVAQADGLPADLARALERCWQEAERPSPLEDALRLTAWLAENREAADLAAALELRRGQGDAEGDRIDTAMQRLGLQPEQLAALVAAVVGHESESQR